MKAMERLGRSLFLGEQFRNIMPNAVDIGKADKAVR
jgi:hypothetical protein